MLADVVAEGHHLLGQCSLVHLAEEHPVFEQSAVLQRPPVLQRLDIGRVGHDHVTVQLRVALA